MKYFTLAEIRKASLARGSPFFSKDNSVNDLEQIAYKNHVVIRMADKVILYRFEGNKTKMQPTRFEGMGKTIADAKAFIDEQEKSK